ncbi:MAG: Fic family protein [Alphaproteobacteria bacterium]|nr:Fic family protein [Alphaproteobacteria bacterium]MBU0797632.1 Fic family protein [Alphaproteobacteria bacterium]MBU0887506.1 Fic family protein [Alphaproteobacteria bacterium]MBU1814743.1 Fic family protein [Alphaproteobacteria bacterium]MBU2091571.1 Fic family protein [Alphaproteobacteria bacterium]
MTWNWQKPEWPRFDWNTLALSDQEARFRYESGIVVGALKHVDDEQKSSLVIEIISTEAVKTSEIEGEILNRDSVQSSLRRNFGLGTDNRRVPPAEQGIADMMTDLHRTFAAPLTHEKLFAWHRMAMNGRTDLTDVGRYRTHAEPMQVISGAIDKPNVHFEAPPSSAMTAEMDRFIAWFNACGPGGDEPLPPLARAGLAHLYFVSIHPFQDGNGRIGRAISEMALSQGLGEPAVMALSDAIQADRKRYYDLLEQSNKELEVTAWLEYFAGVVLDAQSRTLRLVEFLIAKTRLYDRLHNSLNDRQQKVLARLFREGPEGFKGGLSAENYISITGTSTATATRDLGDLVTKGAIMRTGERRHTRYWLNIDGGGE